MNRAEKRRQKKLAAKTAKGQKTAPPNPDSPDHQAASLSLAVQHHAAGRLDEAEKIYRQILQANPDFFNNGFDPFNLILDRSISVIPRISGRISA